MMTAAILNAILALGVLVMVVTPLVWVILTQHRDHARPVATDGAHARPLHPEPRRRAQQPSYQPLAGRA
jgi:hypothetical protein